MNCKLYFPASADVVSLPCYIETNYEGRGLHVTFMKVLNAHYGDYTPAVIQIPAELNPEIVGYGYLAVSRMSADGRYMLGNHTPPVRLSYNDDSGYADLYFERISSDPDIRPAKYICHCKVNSTDY